MRNCNQYIYFSMEKISFKTEERTAKRGGFNGFPSKSFFKKKWFKITFTHWNFENNFLFYGQSSSPTLGNYYGIV